MSKTPLVTVLMTVYNGMPYLPKAIEGILKQSFTDFEFLIIDDGGNDASVECIQSYTDPRIRLEQNEQNMGQVASLNRGLKLARGRYTARMDQDDISLPQRLKQQVDFLEKHADVAVVGTYGHHINSSGQKVGLWRKAIHDYGHFLGFLVWGHNPLWHPAVMFRRDVVLQIGGYDPSVAPTEDYKLWTQMALQRYQAQNIAQDLFLYRVHDNQQSNPTVTLPSRARAHNHFISQFCQSDLSRQVDQPDLSRQVDQPDLSRQVDQPDLSRQVDQPDLSRQVDQPDLSRQVSKLLLIDPDFWDECRSQAQLVSILQATATMLQNMECDLKLSATESQSLRNSLQRRLGYGLTVGLKISNWPAFIFYPIFFLLSPMLIPHVWHTLLPFALKLRQSVQKFTIRRKE